MQKAIGNAGDGQDEHTDNAPSPVVSRRFRCFDELGPAIQGADVQMTLLAREVSEWGFLGAQLRRSTFQMGREGAAITATGSVRPGFAGFSASLGGCAPKRVNGHPFDDRHFIFHGPEAEHFSQSQGPSAWACLALAAEDLARYLTTFTGSELPALPSGAQLVTPEPRLQQAFLGSIRRALTVAQTAPSVLADPEARRGMEEALLGSFVRAWVSSSRECAREVRDHKARTRMAARVEDYLRMHLTEPIYVSDLCLAAGVGERCLRNVFHEFYGSSPVRYLRIRRLNQVRLALRDADRPVTNVTRVATAHGFWELGRFAAAYRALFGESPSETLRGGARRGARWRA